MAMDVKVNAGTGSSMMAGASLREKNAVIAAEQANFSRPDGMGVRAEGVAPTSYTAPTQPGKLETEGTDSSSNADKAQKETPLGQPASEENDSELNSVVTSLNSSIQSIQRNLEFSVDKELGRVIINVKDKETDEVVRQIPSEEALNLARNLQSIVDGMHSRSGDGSTNANRTSEGVFFNSSA